jgi:hypothetical protein
MSNVTSNRKHFSLLLWGFQQYILYKCHLRTLRVIDCGVNIYVLGNLHTSKIEAQVYLHLSAIPQLEAASMKQLPLYT